MTQLKHQDKRWRSSQWLNTPARPETRPNLLFIVNMKVLSVFLSLCTIMTLSQAYTTRPPTTLPILTGPCDYERQHCTHLIGEFCPQCDANGNFLPRQCSGSTGYCWCVDVFSGTKIPNTETGPGVEPVDCGGVWHCPHGWSNYGSRCFMFIDTPKKWIEAEVYCQFDDANLVSIHNQEENRFIMSLTRGDTHDFPETWAGGFDAIHPGYWMWSDGSDFNYNNWYKHPYDIDVDDDDKEHEDEDDDSEGDHDKPHVDDKPPHDHDEEDQKPKNKNCLRINYEYELKWFHAYCTDSLPFVCAKKAMKYM